MFLASKAAPEAPSHVDQVLHRGGGRENPVQLYEQKHKLEMTSFCYGDATQNRLESVLLQAWDLSHDYPNSVCTVGFLAVSLVTP
jgi:hypothetical protein